MDISLGTMAFSIIHVSSFGGGLYDMMAVSKSTQLDGSFDGTIFVSYNFGIYMSTYQGYLGVKLALANIK